MEVLIYPLAFVVLLGILVVVHEYGHYAVARLSGVQILRFSEQTDVISVTVRIEVIDDPRLTGLFPADWPLPAGARPAAD